MSLAVALAALVLANPAAKPAEPAQEALASWYDDAGTTASGTHYAYGYASLMFGSAWGHRVTFCHAGRCVVGRLDDHGPYVSGRAFDLNASLKAALACSDLCWLRWANWRPAPPPGARLVWRPGARLVIR